MFQENHIFLFGIYIYVRKIIICETFGILKNLKLLELKVHNG